MFSRVVVWSVWDIIYSLDVSGVLRGIWGVNGVGLVEFGWGSQMWAVILWFISVILWSMFWELSRSYLTLSEVIAERLSVTESRRHSSKICAT